MINGEYKNLKIFKQRNARKVEKTSPIEDKNREKTVTLVTGFEEESESESESESVTEESYSLYDYEYYAWDPECTTQEQDKDIELTLTLVKRKITGYNKLGMLEELKQQPKTIAIV
tara:strand:- start:91 stop:438 length:348 start_codon:yes stop_codon:yes gene_type:complete